MNKINNNLVKGTFWTAFSRYTNQLFALLIGAILSRLLTPQEFGVVAMVFVFTGFLSVFNDAGIKSYIIQHPTLTKQDESFIFFISIGIGVFLTTLLFLLAPYIEKFYHFKGLANVTRVLSFEFIITAVSFVPRGILERNLKFKTTGLIELTSSVTSGIIGMILALLHFSYWALVIRSLLTFIFMAVLLFVYAKWKPSFKFSRIGFKKLVNYSGNLTLFGAINYWARNLDNLLIGKFIGSSALGYYNRAYSLMTYPITIFSSVVNPILHPVFSIIQSDIEQIRNRYLDVLRLLSLISFPAIAFLAINATSVIRIVWGGQWDQSIPVFQILGIASLFQPILNTTGSIFLVRNKTNWLFKIGVINTAVMIIGFVGGLKYGILGVAIGYVVSFLLMLIPMLYIVFNRLLEGSLWEFFRKISTAIYLTAFISISNLIILYFIHNIYYSILLNAFLAILIFVITIKYCEKGLFEQIRYYLFIVYNQHKGKKR